MIITLTRFIGIGITWCDFMFTIYLPFFSFTFIKREKDIKFINDWKL